MANLSTILSGASFIGLDTVANVQRVISPLSAIVAATTANFYNDFQQIGAGSTVLSLPAAICWVVVVHNLSTTNTVSITITPNGGSAWVSPLILVPGAVFIYWAPYTVTPVIGGAAGVALSASGVNTPVEVLLGG